MAERFNTKKYGIPFGKFSSSNFSEFPTNEVLVGREGSRADLIDFLIHTGPQGSYLITGRRGVGKSNFVDYCLREYKNSVYQRFLRSNLGRSIWELLLLFILAVVGVFLLVCYSQFAPIIVPNIRNNPLLIILLFPLFISIYWLCSYSRKIIMVILIKYTQTEHRFSIPPGFASLLITLTLLAILFFYKSVSFPPSLISRLIVLVCSLYVAAQLPFIAIPIEGEGKFKYLRMPIVIIGLVLFIILGFNLIIPGYSFDAITITSEYKDNILLSIGLLCLGLSIRYSELVSKENLINNSKNRYKSADFEGVHHGTKWIAFIYFILLLLNILTIFQLHIKYNYNNAFIKLIDITCMSLSLSIIIDKYFLNHNKKLKYSRNPYIIINFLTKIKPEAILIFKMLCLLMIAFQITTPLLSELCAYIDKPYLIFDDDVMSLYKLNIEDQYIWVLTVVILFITIYCIEYEWIIRPRIVAREDNALSPGERPKWCGYTLEIKDDQEPDERTWAREFNRSLEKLTFPFLTYAAWIPTLISTINLGFDSLEQRSVIQAMLVSLRQKYHEVFLSWRSIRANLRRFVNFNIILVVIMIVSNIFFNIPDNSIITRGDTIPTKKWQTSEKTITQKSTKENTLEQIKIIKYSKKDTINWNRDYCLYNIIGPDRKVSKFPPIPSLLCKISKDFGNIAIPILYFELIHLNTNENESSSSKLLLFIMLHSNSAFPNKIDNKIDIIPSIPTLSFRVYHLLVLFLIISIFNWINIKLALLSHKRNIQQIDYLLDSLTGKTSRTNTRELSKPAQWIQSIFIDSESHSVEQEKRDPRTIELAFLSVLNDIRRTPNIFPLAFSREMYSQAIEITFVFDELDKLSAHTDMKIKSSDPLLPSDNTQSQEYNEGHDEQNRIVKMQKLLSDMKRIISAAPARFIFVGGRLLYDEWLVDGTKKQPLLTSIFNGQINLQSLMMHNNIHWDNDNFTTKNLTTIANFHSRIEEYLYLQHYYSEKRYIRWVQKRWVPFVGLHDEPQVEAAFSQWVYNIPNNKFHEKLKFISCDKPTEFSKNDENQEDQLSKFYLESFINFLAYRSVGNAKKLKELLASFIRPIGREVKNGKTREKYFSAQDVLTLKGPQIIRIELISLIYEHLRSGFEMQLITRDDKIVEALFHLTDFLFKFHSRAFSWDSLERIDELVHVHRPPDVHRLLEELVEHCSEKFLHKVLNGMYSFRFRSDITKEIEFLSRYYPEEMAAFNFTLDESQTLKKSYIKALKATEKKNLDLIAGLGELYEYDQDFESARHNYRHAIAILDKQLAHVVGSEVSFDGDEQNKIRMLKAFFSGYLCGEKNSTFYLSWGGTRLRLMLKIGMIFERSKNYERAIMQYRQCLMLSNALINAYIKNDLSTKSSNTESFEGDICEHNQLLMHLNVVFQSIFANAWASEKWTVRIDSGTSVIEKELWSLRNRLPFVKDPNITNNAEIKQESVGIGHASFSIIMSQLHNKAGDLYFFKGVQNKEYEVNALGNEGYLLQSHYHYAVSLHEMRRYIFYRKFKSKSIWSFPVGQFGEDRGSPIVEGCWPSHQMLSVSEGLSNLSESTLSQVSLYQLKSEIISSSSDETEPSSSDHSFVNDQKQKIMKLCLIWFEMSDSEIEEKGGEIDLPFGSNRTLPLNDWLGKWSNTDKLYNDIFDQGDKWGLHSDRIVSFSKINSIQDRFLMSLYLSIASADFRENAGYLEDAAREYIQICDTISQYLWWFFSIKQIDEIYPCSEEGSSKKSLDEVKTIGGQYLFHCLSIGVWILEHIDRLYILSRKTPVDSEYKIGKLIPTSALTLASSLGILSQLLFNGSDSDIKNSCVGNLSSRLICLLQVWGLKKSNSFDVVNKNSVENFQNILKNSIAIHKYPVLNQLKSLKLLIDSTILVQSAMNKDCMAWIEEIHELSNQYNSPLHFTPNMTGITYASYWVKCNYLNRNTELINNLNFDLKSEILRSFRSSREMITMGRSYYTSIDSLYYLYDDFNDRLIHRNHAMQMASAELTRRYEKIIMDTI